jgi:Uma2 family endonuclease
MMTDQVRTGISEEELVRPDRENFEVVDGEWVEISEDSMTLLHTFIIDNLVEILRGFLKAHKLGLVHSEGPKYILHVDENGIQTAYKPDLAFLRKGRIPEGFDLYRRAFSGAPDLAVEVVSHGQTTADVLDKVADYLRYGKEEVWVIYPVKQELHRYRHGEEAPEYYTENQTLQAETLFPGLTIKIGDLFIVEQA